MRLGFLSLVFLIAIATQTFGQVPGGAVPGSPQVVSNEKILPEVKLEGVSLADTIQFLRDSDPSVRVMLVRDPAAGEEPTVSLKLKNVTANDVLHLLGSAYPEVHLDYVESQSGPPLTILRIVQGPQQGPPPNVNVYNLSPIVESLTRPKTADQEGVSEKQCLTRRCRSFRRCSIWLSKIKLPSPSFRYTSRPER